MGPNCHPDVEVRQFCNCGNGLGRMDTGASLTDFGDEVQTEPTEEDFDASLTSKASEMCSNFAVLKGVSRDILIHTLPTCVESWNHGALDDPAWRARIVHGTLGGTSTVCFMLGWIGWQSRPRPKGSHPFPFFFFCLLF